MCHFLVCSSHLTYVRHVLPFVQGAGTEDERIPEAKRMLSHMPHMSHLFVPHLLPFVQDAGTEDERIAEAKRMLREADENGDGRISKQVCVSTALWQCDCRCCFLGRCLCCQVLCWFHAAGRVLSLLAPFSPDRCLFWLCCCCCCRLPQEFYNLLRDNVAPDSLSMYDDRLAHNIARAAIAA